MKVSELVEVLKKVDGNMEVVVETYNEYWIELSKKVEVRTVDGKRLILSGNCE